MKHIVRLLILGLSLFSLPAFAQENAPHSASIDGFSFNYDDVFAHNLNVLHYPGDPVEGAGAGFSDAANTIINLYDSSPAPESPLDAVVGIRVYATSDLAQYDFMQAEVDKLQAILSGDANLSNYATRSGGSVALPFLPTLLHGQQLRARVIPVSTEALRGISYVTITPTMAAIEPLVSTSFIYVFQGLSTDGAHYVSLVAKLTTAAFEPSSTIELADLSGRWEAYLQESATTLDAAPSSAFTPQLDSLETLIQSFAFETN